MDDDEQKAYKKYAAAKKHDYARINAFLDILERNGLDEPKKQYVQHIRNLLGIMEHDDAELIVAKPKKPKFPKGFD